MLNVLAVSDFETNRIRKHYQITEQDIKENVKILKTWISQQQHLPQCIDDFFLTGCLIRNKFRIELAKEKIEGYYTLRGVYREFFRPINRQFIPTKEYVIMLPLPKLTKTYERIICLKFRNANPKIYNLNHVLTFIFLLSEIIVRNDFSLGEKFIFDCDGATLDHMTKISINELVKTVKLYQGAYSGRLAGIELINTPPFLNVIMNVFKLVLPAKLYAKIKTHNDLSSLHKLIPKSCLPKEYGGDLGSLDMLQKEWDKVFEENQDFFDRNYHNISNESLRISENLKNDSFGINGTFKKLSFD